MLKVRSVHANYFTLCFQWVLTTICSQVTLYTTTMSATITMNPTMVSVDDICSSSYLQLPYTYTDYHSKVYISRAFCGYEWIGRCDFLDTQTRKPRCRKETARCLSCSFRFTVHRQHLVYKFKSSQASKSSATELQTYRRKTEFNSKWQFQVIQGHVFWSHWKGDKVH